MCTTLTQRRAREIDEASSHWEFWAEEAISSTYKVLKRYGDVEWNGQEIKNDLDHAYTIEKMTLKQEFRTDRLKHYITQALEGR